MELQFNNQNPSPAQSKWSILPSWFVVILLIIVYPLGLLVMWLFASWSKKTKLLITFGPILLMILLWFLVISSLYRTNEKVKEQAGIPQEKGMAVSVQDNGQLVYANNNIGYSISYPKNWRASEGRYDDQRKIQTVTLVAPGYIAGVRGVRIDIDNEPNARGYKNLDDYVNSIEFFVQIISKKDLTINGNVAKQFIFSGGRINTFIYNDKNIFTISYVADNENQDDYATTYQDIIQTFELNG